MPIYNFTFVYMCIYMYNVVRIIMYVCNAMHVHVLTVLSLDRSKGLFSIDCMHACMYVCMHACMSVCKIQGAFKYVWINHEFKLQGAFKYVWIDPRALTTDQALIVSACVTF